MKQRAESLEAVNAQRARYLSIAMTLSLITIFYNLIEGAVSTAFGASDETIALLGFGLDSFVEVISGLGIAHMIWRIKARADEPAAVATADDTDSFERTALRVTGGAFYLLAAGLVVGGGLSLYFGQSPETTVVGAIIALASIATMWILYHYKRKYGRLLDSDAILADASCTKTCIYLSFILLGSSVLFELFRVAFVDVVGGLGIAWYAFREGREAFEKSRSGKLVCGDCDHGH